MWISPPAHRFVDEPVRMTVTLAPATEFERYADDCKINLPKDMLVRSAEGRVGRIIRAWVSDGSLMGEIEIDAGENGISLLGCPYCDTFVIDEITHMATEHPDIVRQRREDAGYRHDGARWIDTLGADDE